MKRVITVALMLLLVLLAACSGGGTSTTSTTSSTQMVGTEVKVDGGSYWVITAAQLNGFKTKDFLLVNVDSTPVMIIQGTDIYVKPDELSQSMNKFPADKSAKIVVYCMSGVKSVEVATALAKAGYTRVMELQGGIVKWQQQGYPAVTYTKAPN